MDFFLLQKIFILTVVIISIMTTVTGAGKRPTLDTVTNATCPPDKHFKCLPYGTCYGFDEYCDNETRNHPSCFPSDVRNDETKLLSWCSDSKPWFKPSPCQFACFYRFSVQKFYHTSCETSTPSQSSCPPPEQPQQSWSNETVLCDVPWNKDVCEYLSSLLTDMRNIVTKALNGCSEAHQENETTSLFNTSSVINTSREHNISPENSFDKSSLRAGLGIQTVILYFSVALNIYLLVQTKCGGTFRRKKENLREISVLTQEGETETVNRKREEKLEAARAEAHGQNRQQSRDSTPGGTTSNAASQLSGAERPPENEPFLPTMRQMTEGGGGARYSQQDDRDVSSETAV